MRGPRPLSRNQLTVRLSPMGVISIRPHDERVQWSRGESFGCTLPSSRVLFPVWAISLSSPSKVTRSPTDTWQTTEHRTKIGRWTSRKRFAMLLLYWDNSLVLLYKGTRLQGQNKEQPLSGRWFNNRDANRVIVHHGQSAHKGQLSFPSHTEQSALTKPTLPLLVVLGSCVISFDQKQSSHRYQNN